MSPFGILHSRLSRLRALPGSGCEKQENLMAFIRFGAQAAEAGIKRSESLRALRTFLGSVCIEKPFIKGFPNAVSLPLPGGAAAGAAGEGQAAPADGQAHFVRLDQHVLAL